MRKYLIISLLASYSIVFAGESEDFKDLYKIFSPYSPQKIGLKKL